MAARLSTCFLSYGLGDLNCNRCSKMRLIVPYPRLFPASCKMRQQRSISSQPRRAKKVNPEEPPKNGNFDMNVIEDSDSESDNAGTDSASISGQEFFPSVDSEQPPENGNCIMNVVEERDSDNENAGTDSASNSGQETVVDVDSNVQSSMDQNWNVDLASQAPDQDMDSPVVSGNPGVVKHYTSMEQPASGGQLSSTQVDDLIDMIRNAERNILLLNQARVRALEDLERILSEKEGLQSEINNLEMRLAKTNAKIKVAAQEKVHAELLEDQLGRLRTELTGRSGDEINQFDMYDLRNNVLNDSGSKLIDSSLKALKEEVDLLRALKFVVCF